MSEPWDTEANMILYLRWKLDTPMRKCRQFYAEHRGTNLTLWYQTWLDMLESAKKQKLEEVTRKCLQ